MATFGVNLPDELQKELDEIAKVWYSSRSKAIVRIFQEWKRDQAQRQVASLPRFIPNRAPVVAGKSEEIEGVYLGTGPGDDI